MISRLKFIGATLLWPALLIGGDAPGKLDGRLQKIYDAWKTKGKAGMRAEAAARGVKVYPRNRFSVRITAIDEKSVAVIRQVMAKSGARILSAISGALFAEVPVSFLSKLAAREEVTGIYLDRGEQFY